MAYLSRIPLDPMRSGTRKLLENPQAMHAAVLGGVSVQPVTERVLWRLEQSRDACNVLVQTESAAPTWENLIDQAGICGDSPATFRVADMGALLEHLDEGSEFAFRLRANPTSSTKTPLNPTPNQQSRLAQLARPRGVRVGHRTADAQLRWFLERASGGKSRWGFSVDISGEPRVTLMGRESVWFFKGGHRVSLATATFAGRLVVTDVALFREHLLGGIGPAKAYGCGLLTLGPVG